tara:strand:+ start:1928 stop:2425 length:498 start_codon:yes stop_codon:yes gene_type:complete
MIYKLEALLINLEDSIFNLVRNKIANDKRTNKRIFTIEETLLLMNINFSINKELVTSYNESFKIYYKDIDILNLIIKYIKTCSKIVLIQYKSEKDDGIIELEYHPKYDIYSLNDTYFIEKYTKPINHYQYDSYNLMLKVITNILLPFTINYCINSYHKDKQLIIY